MELNDTIETPSFTARVGMAFRVLFDGTFARQVAAGLALAEASESKPEPKQTRSAATAPAIAQERVHASGLLVLAALQREGRLIDFLEQDVAGFADEEVGAAARVVHSGCRKVLKQYFKFEPAADTAEGSTMTVPAGFDAQRIRLTGNVSGQPPFKGTLKHHGWIAREVHLPAVAESLDPRIIAPAEVELA
jgi:hypothetical protein